MRPAKIDGRRPDDRLRSDPVFRRYWSAHAINTAGSTVTVVVLPILVFQRTGSALQTSLIDAVYLAPYMLLGLFAGALADRTDRRQLMIRSRLVSAGALGSIPFASALGVLSTGQIFAATAIAGTAFVGFDAAQFAALPALFGRSRLIMTMTALGSIDSALYVVGPSVGGLLATTIGPAPAITLDAASFLASAALLVTVRGNYGKPQGYAGEQPPRWRSEIAEGVRFLWRHPLMRALTLGGAVSALSGGAVSGLLVVFSVRQLMVGSHDARIGLLFTAGAVGTLAGTAVIPRLTRRFAIPRLNLISRTTSLLLMVIFAVQRDFVLALLVNLAFSAAEMLAIRSAITFRQLHTPDELQGRVNVVARMTALSGTPLGAALGGGLAQILDVRAALLIMSAALALSTIAGWIGPLRTAGRAGPVRSGS